MARDFSDSDDEGEGEEVDGNLDADRDLDARPFESSPRPSPSTDADNAAIGSNSDIAIGSTSRTSSSTNTRISSNCSSGRYVGPSEHAPLLVKDNVELYFRDQVGFICSPFCCPDTSLCQSKNLL